jgi:hypothetical protein
MNPVLNGPAPAEDQGKLLEEALNVVKVQAHHMKKCLVSTSLQALKWGMLDVRLHIACVIGPIFVLAAINRLMKLQSVNLTTGV